VRSTRGIYFEGTFYKEDLQKVDVPDDALFRVEKVLQRRRKEVKVRWKGWPKKCDSWIPKSSLTRLRGSWDENGVELDEDVKKGSTV